MPDYTITEERNATTPDASVLASFVLVIALFPIFNPPNIDVFVNNFIVGLKSKIVNKMFNLLERYVLYINKSLKGEVKVTIRPFV